MQKMFSEVVKQDLERITETLDPLFKEMAGSTVCITGGAGFLGYYLSQAPLYWNLERAGSKKIEIVILDNFLRGCPPWLTRLQSHGIKVVKHNISQNFPKGINPKYIFHAASVASPVFYRKYPIETIEANVLGLRNVLLHMKDSGTVESAVCFSSSEVYGDPAPEKIPTSEDYWGNVSCTGPRACYDESKRLGETLCIAYHQQHGLPIKIVRPFNNYGPGLSIDDRRVLPDFMKCVTNNEDIVLLSDGTPSRTFLYSSDAITGYYLALLKGNAAEPYNIGSNGPEISIRDLAEKVVAIANREIGYGGDLLFKNSEHKQYLTDNPQRRCPDITKAQTELAFSPQVDLDTGLALSLRWYQENLG